MHPVSIEPVVSVLLPVLNGGRLFRRAVKSILDQSLEQLELVIIDDASMDETPAFAAGLVEYDPRVRYVRHKQNQGVAASLNEGLHVARARYVARMDADDESLPDRLLTQVAFMDAHPEVVAAGSYVYHMGARPRFDRLVTLPTSAGEVHDTLRRYNCLYHPAVILRRSPIVELGGYRAEFNNAEDYDLWLRASRSGQVCNIPEPLLRYRFSPGGATLGRKWQQLYYVYLAQVANIDVEMTLEQARPQADQMVRTTDRRQFISDVATGTVRELLELRLWRDAARVVATFETELDTDTFTSLARQVLRAAVAPLPPR